MKIFPCVRGGGCGGVGYNILRSVLRSRGGVRGVSWGGGGKLLGVWWRNAGRVESYTNLCLKPSVIVDYTSWADRFAVVFFAGSAIDAPLGSVLLSGPEGGG